MGVFISPLKPLKGLVEKLERIADQATSSAHVIAHTIGGWETTLQRQEPPTGKAAIAAVGREAWGEPGGIQTYPAADLLRSDDPAVRRRAMAPDLLTQHLLRRRAEHAGCPANVPLMRAKTELPLWRRVKWISGIIWIWSWSVVYREIFQWHHMTTSLRFNPPPPLPGTDIQPQAGLPVRTALAAAAIAPIVFITSAIMDRLSTRPNQIN